MVSVAHEHDSLVIADKLETGESLALAIDAGVDYISGYIIQLPQEQLETEESMEIQRRSLLSNHQSYSL